MTRHTTISIAMAAAFAAMSATTALADGNARTFSTKLIGYNETPLTINSGGSGTFAASVNKDGTAISYTLSYRDLSAEVTQAHIHFGRPALTGQIVLFLCFNPALVAQPLGVPLPQTCPPAPATISGTLTAADVIPRANQGIDASTTGFAEMIKAIREGAAYANVHSVNFPTGEIRGAIGPGDDEENN
ncbi:MAG: CHRD domain-containing protein [Pseudomonadota bacterium]|nr:CHRD domain-containing protein [Pseudomonadota bacterium]